MRFKILIILSFVLYSTLQAASTGELAETPSAFQKQVAAKMSTIEQVADAYQQYLKDLRTNLTENPSAFIAHIGYELPSDMPTAAVELLTTVMYEDMQMWNMIKTLAKAPMDCTALERAEFLLNHLAMEHGKYTKDAEEFYKEAQATTRPTIRTIDGKAVLGTEADHPIVAFRKLFLLTELQQLATTLDFLIEDLLPLMPEALRKDFTKYKPNFSNEHKALPVSTYPHVSRKSIKGRPMIDIILSTGYRLFVPADPAPYFLKATMSIATKEGVKAMESYCGFMVILPSGARFTLRNQRTEEIEAAIKRVNELTEPASEHKRLKDQYPTWEKDWEALEIASKKATERASAVEEEEVSVLVSSATGKSKGKKIAKTPHASAAAAGAGKTPTASGAEHALASAPLSPAEVLAISKEAVAIKPPVKLDGKYKPLVSSLLSATDVKRYKWNQVLSLIGQLGGEALSAPDLGLFSFEQEDMYKYIKVYYPRFSNGRLTPYAAHSLLEGLAHVGWTRERLAAL